MKPLIIKIESTGGTVEDCSKIVEQIKAAEAEGRGVIMIVDSPGSFGMYKVNYNDIRPLTTELKPTKVKPLITSFK